MMELSQWADLPSELLDGVAAHLAPNEVACILKSINKAAAEHLKSYAQVKLSQPVPQHAFAWRWGRPDSTRDMTLKQRHHLLALTARSGVLANLQLAHMAAGCTLANELVFDSAGASGSLEVCQWLLTNTAFDSRQRKAMIRSAAAAGHLQLVRWLLQQERATWRFWGQQERQLSVEALIAAVCAGQRAVCEGLLADGAPVLYEAVGAAFVNGHVALGEWLREGLMLPNYVVKESLGVLYSAVSALDLTSFQRVYTLLFSKRPFSPSCRLIGRAIFSPTPDWRAKVTWLEQQDENGVVPCTPLSFDNELERDVETVMRVGPDALERLQLLRERGALSQIVVGLFSTAERARNLPVLEYLWMAGPEAGPEGEEALRQEESRLTSYAAKSGSVEVMRWLRERGCPWAQGTFEAAIQSGSVPLIEMLAAEGCPMQEYDIMRNACFGDLLTLTCLRQLGFHWSPAGKTLTGAIVDGCSPQQLQRLLDMDCPVDWHMARRVAVRVRAEGVRLWVEAQMQAAGISPTAESIEDYTTPDSDEG